MNESRIRTRKDIEDTMSEAIIAITRSEEKINNLIEEINTLKQTLLSNREKLHALELCTAINTSDLQSITKFFWVLSSAVIVMLVSGVGYYVGLVR